MIYIRKKMSKLLQRAYDNYINERYDDVIKLLKEYIERNPNDIDASYLFADSLYYRSEYGTAQKIAEHVVKVCDVYLPAATLLAKICFEMGDLGKVINLLSGELENNASKYVEDEQLIPEYEYANFLLWQAYDDVGNYQSALSVARKMCNISHDSVKWNGYLQHSLLKIGDVCGAVLIMGDEIDLIKRSILDVGYDSVCNADYSLALNMFLQYLSLCSLPRDLYALKPYYQLLITLGRYSDVIVSYRRWSSDIANSHCEEIFSLHLLAAYAYWCHGNMVESRKIISERLNRIGMVTDLIDHEFVNLVSKISAMYAVVTNE